MESSSESSEQAKPRILSKCQPVVEALTSAFGDRLKTVVVFGSQARGTSHERSDFDIFVVIEGLPTDRLIRQRTVRSSLLPYLDRLPGAVAFAAKTPPELDVNLTPLLLDVFVEGICLFGHRYFERYHLKTLKALGQSGLQRERIGDTLMWLFPHLPDGDWELSWEGYREST